MKKEIKIGSSDFKRIIDDNGYLVDKTMLIKEFLDNGSYVLLMPRPKRFGKTLNLSMIEYFFDIQKLDSAKIFSDFEIINKKEFCNEHQNKYPVINISLKSVKETNWENCLSKFKIEISELYQQHRYLLKSEKLELEDKQIFQKITSKIADEAEYQKSLGNLCYYLQKHFNQEVIVLVDEYDAPIITSFRYTAKPIKNFQKEKLTYYEKVIGFMQSFLGDTFKGNKSLKKGLITGVMRVGKESIFSEWNNFDVFGVTSTYFSDKFGFTQQETEKILTHFNLEDKIKDIQKWYDGYQFGNTDKIYNPWSIVNYISKKNDGFKAYWINASDDSLIKAKISEPNIKDTIEKLIAGETIVKIIRENFVFPDFEQKSELLWTLLLQSGFLTAKKKVSLNRYELAIPNYELKFVFTDLILDWIEVKYKLNQDLLINASNHLINNELEDFEECFKKIVGDTLSYFDFAPVREKRKGKIVIPQERFFQVYTLGLLAILSNDYIIKSNRESGEGRYDIILIPYDKKNNGIILEIKYIENQKDTEEYTDFTDRINRKINEALQQIERKKYYKELIANKIEQIKIIRVPIVFAGKEPYVMEITEE